MLNAKKNEVKILTTRKFNLPSKLGEIESSNQKTLGKETTPQSVRNRQLQEFKELYFRQYGLELSDVETQDMAENFLSLYRTLLKPKIKP